MIKIPNSKDHPLIFKLIFMNANELRRKYLDFFASKGHTIIPSASLVPRETDASTLFTTAGMHPLVPYLLGQEHPGGKRVANVQKCVRTGDIEDVGDNRHLTFFEMMGNWSFGDYFKKEAIEWSFEFLTSPQWLGLDKNRLYVTVFKGEPASDEGGEDIPRDEEAIAIWQEVFAKAGMAAEVAANDEIVKENVRIIPLGIEDNFWIAGTTGPCGGDTEMFYDVRSDEERAENPLEGKFGDLVDSFKLIEVWNDVFMEFNKTAEGKYEKLAKPNVDTGMGVERTLMVLEGEKTVFETEIFELIFAKIAELCGKKYSESTESTKAFRIIADHVRAASFIIADGITPSNTGAGYVLRRLIRRAVRYGKLLGIEGDFTAQVAAVAISQFGDFYGELVTQNTVILEELTKEEQKFSRTLENGMRLFGKMQEVGGKEAFDLYATYGFPLEMTKELAKEKGILVDEKAFEQELKKHQELSRTASAGMFKGGLQDSGEETKRLHTAAHLMLAGLRKVLGDHVIQKGSNITPERLRFDFAHGEKMTQEQKEAVESYVNAAIAADAPVSFEEMELDKARLSGAMGVFEAKYGEKVTVYTVEKGGVVYSREICGGPHAERTGVLGKFRIVKEEASSAGVRRIKAVLE